MKVFRYHNNKTNQSIGYHISTFCQTSTDIAQAKRYECETDEEVKRQLETITGNVTSVLESTPETDEKRWFKLNPIKERFFKGLSVGDVDIVVEDVPNVEIVYKVTQVK
jgi:hypothetical protein